MMAALWGTIEHYDPQTEEWPEYVERMEHFFEANGLVAEEANVSKRRSTFLTLMGPTTYKLLRSLIEPSRPQDKTFEELVEVLTKHYSPQPAEIMQRYRFYTRVRHPNETVAEFVADLRRLAKHCNFGDTLEKMLRDRLACGINDSSIQKKLLAERDLTFNRALSIAEGTEAADRDFKEMKTPKANHTRVKEEPVDQVKGKGNPKPQITCYRCGLPGHLANECRHKQTKCRSCGKKGHLERVCRSKQAAKTLAKEPKGKKSFRQAKVEQEDSSSEDNEWTHTINRVGKRTGKVPPIKVPLTVDSQSIVMEVDTGATVSLISKKLFDKLWPGRRVEPSNVRLRSYSNEPIPVVGTVDTKVSYEGQEATLPLVVVEGDGSTLLGRNWLKFIRLNWSNIHAVLSTGLHEVVSRYDDVFQPGLGEYKGFHARIDVDPQATPRFYKARTVPYAMRSLVDVELDRLVKEGTLEPVDHSDWAAPIVSVWKPDKKRVRICGDFRVTVNPVSKLNRYPIPKVEDLFATLKSGKIFTKLDLSQAYQQLSLDEESRKYVVINTQKGLFRYTRLPYGISSAPGIFQRVMENLLKDIPRVMVYLDDIVITSDSEAEHLRTLDTVLSKLSTAGLRAQKEKCTFMASSVTYLGHLIDDTGLHPLLDKVRAIQEVPTPRNVAALKSYLGLLTYYSKFLPNLSTKLAPLNKLLSPKVKWKWTTAQDKAFQESKNLLVSSQLLVHFDPSLPITLACDASNYGIGAVLAHTLPDGSERPIAYASRTLNSAEKNYSQLEKEGLACVFGVKKFYNYVFGHKFELITDHKPLLRLLGSEKPTSPQASARVRRWLLYLSQFEYSLEFRGTKEHANADALSRLPLPIVKKEHTPPELVLLTEYLDNSPVTSKQIKSATTKDRQLSIIVQYLQKGWPTVCPDDELKPYFSRQCELSLYDGCVLWGSRVVVPPTYRHAVLTELHDGHPGMARMKSLARMYVWWPGISADIETRVRQCHACQQQQSVPAVAPLRPWSWPTRPWARLHLDYAGPLDGRMFLILIDAHSKWIEAFHTRTATSAAVIDELRTVFATFGLPEILVTDNGTCFTSAEFESFLQSNGIEHLTSAPYHPSSNGLAERAVQIVKKGLKKVKEGSIRVRLAKILLTYRTTPQSTTGLTPASMLLKKHPRTILDLLKPNTAEKVEAAQRKQKSQHDAKAKTREFQVGDSVYARNYLQGDKWVPGNIIEKTGPQMFVVQLASGRSRRCHLDQIRSRKGEIENSTSHDFPEVDIPEPPNDPSNHSSERSTELEQLSSEPPDSNASDTTNSDTGHPATAVKVYPQRTRHPVQRYEPNWT